MKLLLIILSALLLLYLVVAYAVDNIAPYGIITPLRPEHSTGNPAKFGMTYQTLEIQTRDSVKLRAWFIYNSDSISDVNVIVLHGISDSKTSNILRAKLLLNSGCNALLLDLRAHGQSSGKYCTFGYYEKKDISSVIDYLSRELGSDQVYGIWGTSLGGAVALQSLEYDKRLKFGIVESCFSSLKQVVRDYTKNYTGFELDWLADRALSSAGRIADFKTYDVSPERSASHITQPVLYIHGARDERISARYGYMIYKSLKSTYKELYIVNNAGHLNVPQKGNQEYRSRIKNFISRVKTQLLKKNPDSISEPGS